MKKIIENSKMEQEQNFKLIDGEFSPTESNNILLALISNNKKNHSLEAFIAQERGAGNLEYHTHRIKELNDTYSEIKAIISFASENDLKLKINSKIEISLIK